MKDKRNFKVFILLLAIMLFSSLLNAQDIKLKIPKASIENAINALIYSRALSYGSYDDEGYVTYYSFKPKSGTVTLSSGNQFSITLNADFLANFNVLVFDFDKSFNDRNITLDGTVQIRPLATGYKIVFVPNHISSSGDGLFDLVFNVASSGILAKLPEMSININNPVLPVVMGEYFTSPVPSLTTSADGVELGLVMKAGPRYITALNDVNGRVDIGNVQDEEGTNNYVSYQSPKIFEWNTGTLQKLQTQDALLDASNGKNKYRNWYKKSEDIGVSEVAPRRIPVTVETTDETYGAKFELAKRVQLSNILEGCLSGGTVTYESTTLSSTYDNYEFYNNVIQHPITTTVPNGTSGRNWSFFSWSDGDINPSRNIVVSKDWNLTALYKASLLSNNANAFSNSGQRKFIRTPDGYHHLVYESMGKIWYERSGDNGATWTIQNNGKPINTDYVRSENGTVTGTGAYTTAKEPAIDYMNNNVVIVWQEQSGANYVIRLAVFSNGQHVYPINNSPLNDIPFATYGQYTEDTTPQIAIKDNSYAVIAIRRNDAYAKGIECHLVLLNAPGGVASNETQGIIPGTDGYSSNFTLSTDRCYTNKYHIAWQQDDGYTSRLNYAKIYFDMSAEDYPPYEISWSMAADETVNITDNIYCAAAYSPSMISAENGTARMAFKGYTEDGEYYLMFVNPDDLSWVPYLNKYGGEIFSPQVSSGSETYYVGWTEPVGSSYKTVCTDSYTLRNMETVNNSSGRDIQINLGGTRSERFSMGFNSERGSAPYSFTRSEAIGTIQVNKSTPISNGRAVVINKDKAQLYFILGNVKSEGVNIDFVKAEDTVSLRGDLKKVNRFLVSKPFTLKDNSAFSFALRYGTSDSLKSMGYFDKKDAFTSFKLELVDAQSGERLGSYINEKMSKDNLFTKKEASFKVSSEGLGTNRLVSLRLSVDENTPSEYTISDMILGKGLSLSKSLGEKEVSYKGEAAVKEFSLDQNYPNPFNPATVINYALPKASFVTLKVYDVLGKEVTTLVNGYKAEGRYSVQFNASHLPSGIYIYQITAGSNVVSKKMMLIK